MKYVIVVSMGLEVPILLDACVSHDTIRGAVSAGFVDLVPVGSDVVLVNTYGESVSLRKESRGEEDAKLICRMLSKCTRGEVVYVSKLTGGVK
jgi:hypothetical protein